MTMKPEGALIRGTKIVATPGPPPIGSFFPKATMEMARVEQTQ